MIYIKLTGGLGNQMFQYAAARWVQSVTGQEICLDYSDFQDYENNHNAYFENTLKNMEIKYNKVITSKNEFKTEIPELSKEYYKLYKKLYLIGRTLLFEGRIFIERKYQNQWNKKGLIFARDAYIPIFPENIENKDVVMSGFFQSEKYFPQMREKLVREFQVKKPINAANQAWIDKIDSTQSVCFHIRRGDYALKGRSHCTVNYYQKALKKMQGKIPEAVFFVFSDDISWVKGNIDLKSYNVNYVDENNDSCDEIRLMARCKHFIISNSSFSWWAQYLGQYEEKVVIAPRPWFRRIPTDIYLNGWITIPVYE